MDSSLLASIQKGKGLKKVDPSLKKGARETEKAQDKLTFEQMRRRH